VFKKNIPYDNKLKLLVADSPSHKFLANPISQYIFLYLVDYVIEVSKLHFNKELKDIRMLDWGSGKGHITYMLNERQANVKSCDILSESHDSTFGQETPIITKEKIDVIPLTHPYILPFEDSSFEVIISMGVLEHVPNDFESLKEINRVLSPKGMLFCFFLPYNYSWTQKVAHLRGDRYHDRFYNKKVVGSLLEKSSFEMLDFWHRSLLVKNSINYPAYKKVEHLDNLLCNTPLKHLATNVEFLAVKK
jgi:SAM-dependent methyltransferase